MKDLQELGINDNGRVVLRRTPTDSDIQAFEAEFDLTLPVGVIQLLRHSNGGHPERNTFYPPGPERGDGVAIDHLYFLDGDDHGEESLWLATHQWRPFLGPRALPFASDGGGNQFFIDLTDGCVKICWHDAEMVTSLLAESFEAFVDALEIDDELV